MSTNGTLDTSSANASASTTAPKAAATPTTAAATAKSGVVSTIRFEFVPEITTVRAQTLRFLTQLRKASHGNGYVNEADADGLAPRSMSFPVRNGTGNESNTFADIPGVIDEPLTPLIPENEKVADKNESLDGSANKSDEKLVSKPADVARERHISLHLDKVVALFNSIETFLVDVVSKEQSDAGKLKKEIANLERQVTSISSDRDNANQLVQKIMKAQLDKKTSTPTPPQTATGEMSPQQKYDEVFEKFFK